jgi:hypothetical protein
MFFYAASLPAQTPTLIIGTGGVCAGQEVLIPVTGSNLLNVGAISLKISFDNTLLTYLSLENFDPQLLGMVYNYNADSSKIAFVWSNVSPVNFQEGKLFDIRFMPTGKPGSIVFKPGCEIADNFAQVIPVLFNNGGVYPGWPVIDSQPHDTTVKSGMNLRFTVVSENTDFYNWKESRDKGSSWNLLNDEGIYTGTRTNKLIISQIPVFYDGFKYRCTLMKDNCYTETDAVKLTVDSLMTISEITKPGVFLKQNHPNPFNVTTEIEYFIPQPGNIKIKIFDRFGKLISTLVNTQQSKGNHVINFNPGELPAGLYFYVLEYQNNNTSYTGYKKMTKICP